MNKQEKTKGVVAIFHLHDDNSYLSFAIESVKGHCPIKAFVSKVSWNNDHGDWQETVRVCEEAGVEVILGEWSSENEHRRAAMQHCLNEGYSHALIPDGDEILEPELICHLLRIAEQDLADRVYVTWDTYWKTPEHVIRPREQFKPCMLINLNVAEQTHLREHRGGRSLLLDDTFGLVHHLSYVGPDERIYRKVTTWSHKDELVPHWWEQVWKAWDDNPLLRNLHPTHPEAFQFAERIPCPKALFGVKEKWDQLDGLPYTPEDTSEQWPLISLVIPVHGGEQMLRTCLGTLQPFSYLFKEVIVVDNASEDDCLGVCNEFDFVTVIKNPSNAGFAKACNQGIESSTGEYILFLNSDALLTRPALKRMVEPLIKSGTVGASGPMSNNVGHFQKLEPTYTSLENMPLFAADLARVEKEPIDVDMLVGFCLLARRSALEDVGYFDERFGLGTYEDNDLCYRLRRSGWRLALVPNSFVHHFGSQTLTKVWSETGNRLNQNEQLYHDKWKADIDSGFASHLSGTGPEQIVFQESLKPEKRMKEIEQKRKKANVSLCMIVKDEERVLSDCLGSAAPFFNQTIVVDTGSSDKTVEIAKEHGAEVSEIEWPDSFAAARNKSLETAQGDWIFWLDADDTLPFACGEAILDAAINRA